MSCSCCWSPDVRSTAQLHFLRRAGPQRAYDDCSQRISRAICRTGVSLCSRDKSSPESWPDECNDVTDVSRLWTLAKRKENVHFEIYSGIYPENLLWLWPIMNLIVSQTCLVVHVLVGRQHRLRQRHVHVDARTTLAVAAH